MRLHDWFDAISVTLRVDARVRLPVRQLSDHPRDLHVATSLLQRPQLQANSILPNIYVRKVRIVPYKCIPYSALRIPDLHSRAHDSRARGTPTYQISPNKSSADPE
jgi:hypothetical protein